MTLQELINRALSGDKEAFNAIIEEHDSSVRLYVVSLCGNEFDCNDILQEAYIKAFLNLSKYDTKYPMNVWLKSIARNTFIDAKRKESRIGNTTDNFDDIASEEALSPEELIITAERIKKAEKELATLPPAYREIIELRYFQSMSYQEISEILSQPIGTVKTHLFRAKKLLYNIIINLDNS